MCLTYADLSNCYLEGVDLREAQEQHEAGDNSCAKAAEAKPLAHPCPCCGGRMIIIETFQRGASPRYRPAASTAVIRIDTS